MKEFIGTYCRTPFVSVYQLQSC